MGDQSALGVLEPGRSDVAPDPGPRFDADVARYHRHVETADWDDIYVVGDVHGCLAQLEALLDRLDPSDDDLLLFVGDLVRKGPASREVLDLVRDSPNMLSVRGNNEAKVIHDRVDLPEVEPVRDYVEAMPVAITFDDAMVVHGGVDPRRPIAAHGMVDLQETRAIPPENGYDGPFWWELHEGPPHVFFGHSVLAEPVEEAWATGLDTGCVYGGELTAYDYYADAFVSVPGRTHQERSDEKIISPGSH
jgi:serine/threonine protein phosphatase 1